MYPEDVKREGNHPAPFPEKLPARLIRMYTYGAAGDFEGEVVLDRFAERARLAPSPSGCGGGSLESI